MARARPTSVALAASFRTLVARVVALFLLVASLSLVYISRTHNPALQHARMAIAGAMVPVLNALSKPSDAIVAAGNWLHEMASLREENSALKSENARLRQWQAAATELQSENSRLHDLLHFAPAGVTTFTTARVAADMDSPYTRSAIITSGTDQGVKQDQVVVSDGGLAGRIVEIGNNTARILLLCDVNSRIPVISETSRERAVAGGDGGDMLSLSYLPAQSNLKVGEKIITTGDGNVLPAGLPVGVVTKISKGVVTVKPFVDWYHLEYVSVVDFSM